MASVCPECGKKLPDGATTCNWCKPESEAYARPGYVCPSCGVNLPDGRPCPYCAVSEPTTSTEQTSTEDGLRKGQTFEIVIAVIVGIVLWGLTLILSKLAQVFGPSGASELLLFFAPIFGLVLPLIARRPGPNAVTSRVWLIALAPLAGILNFALLFIVYGIAQAFFGHNDVTLNAAITGVILIWILPFYKLRRRGTNQTQDEGTNDGQT